MNSSTVWPATPIAQPVRNVMSLLLNLLDDKGDDAGDRLADDVFTSNGYMGAAHAPAKGSAEIRKSRQTAWDKVDFRRHEIARVFAANDRDFLFIGNAAFRAKNGNSFKEEFIARAIVDDPYSPQPRIEYFTVWPDTLALANALKDA